MKKLLYVIAFTLVACVSLSSCTEEVVKPKGTQTNSGSALKE